MNKPAYILRFLRSRLTNMLFSMFKLIPKKPNLLLFGSWFGEKYADNTKYLFEHFYNNEPDYRVVWLTRNENVIKELTALELPVEKIGSMRAMLLQLRAKYLFATIGYEDFNRYLWGGQYLINCWHGVGIKKTGYATLEIGSQAHTKCKLKDYPYQRQTKQIVISTSPFMTSCFQKAFFATTQFEEIGYPRNDLFFLSKLRQGIDTEVTKLSSSKRVILYMPTHRRDGAQSMPMVELLDLQTIQNLCENNDSIFLIKKHYYHRNEVENFERYDRIYDITRKSFDVQMLLFQSDILITDYSSCAYDYLLLNRPIVYYCYDIQEYTEHDRELYVPFMTTVAGAFCDNKEDLAKELVTALQGESDYYSEKRAKIREMFYNKDAQQAVSINFVNLIHKIELENKKGQE